MLDAYQLTLNRMNILIALLQRYPDFCTHEELFARLFPLAASISREILEANWKSNTRPVRRAINLLNAVLGHFGLTVYTVRGKGYMLGKLVD